MVDADGPARRGGSRSALEITRDVIQQQEVVSKSWPTAASATSG